MCQGPLFLFSVVTPSLLISSYITCSTNKCVNHSCNRMFVVTRKTYIIFLTCVYYFTYKKKFTYQNNKKYTGVQGLDNYRKLLNSFCTQVNITI